MNKVSEKKTSNKIEYKIAPDNLNILSDSARPRFSSLGDLKTGQKANPTIVPATNPEIKLMKLPMKNSPFSVSYTHLTLPTICSV